MAGRHTLRRRHAEVWYTLVAIAAVTAVYLASYQQAGGLPAASGFVGHGIGILGFILMLMTETLYSIRKRLNDARWGSMAGWLRFHIVTGLVGPYMVLLHTSMVFGGLAGAVMLLTIAVVISGLIGRYIYTTAALAPDGAGPDLPEPGATGPGATGPDRPRPWGLPDRRTLAAWRSVHVPLTWTLFATAGVHVVAALYYATLQR